MGRPTFPRSPHAVRQSRVMINFANLFTPLRKETRILNPPVISSIISCH
jgi:hypothetical protein